VPADVTPRVIGGEDTEPGSIPWQAHLEIERDGQVDDDSQRCGGVLVHPRIVLTAAHCVSGVGKNHRHGNTI
jgi:secreted trypsin-like serine protease